MGKLSTVTWICFCFGFYAITSCFKTQYRKQIPENVNETKYSRHNNWSPSFLPERSLLDNFEHGKYNQSSENFDKIQRDFFEEGEILVSEVLVEEEGKVPYLDKFKKRHVRESEYDEETKQMILDLHNLYRSNVTPPAANMAHMEWDDELAHYAQLWADNCVFEHGTPPNTEYSRGPYGQNLYLGLDRDGYNAMWLWYDEYRNYDVRRLYCQPKTQCGHYVQMAWEDSNRLGCGVRKCNSRWLIVCHYFGPALVGRQMYKIGRPCSQCPGKKGSLCRSNLCFDWDQCARLPLLCADAHCNMYCHNCGRLIPDECRCECADGYDGTDCSRPCTNEHKMCGQNPGFPDSSTCSLNKYAIANKYCRKMCGTCKEAVPGYGNTCCEGKVCEDGSVLDFDGKVCACKLLCPGPKCGSGFCIRNRAMHLVLSLFIWYFFQTYLSKHFAT